jgi:hypothetical protein
MFDLNPVTCDSKFQILIKIQGDDFVQYAKKAKQASKNLDFDILNEVGQHNLEIILSILFK